MVPLSYWIYNFDDTSLKEISAAAGVKTTDEIVAALPKGVYTSFRTKGLTHAFQLNAHFQRLVDSLCRMGRKFPYSLEDIRQPLRKILGSLRPISYRIRLHIPLESLNRCYIMVDPLISYPQEVYERGVRVKTNRLKRGNPKAKLTEFVAAAQAEKLLTWQLGLEESLLVTDDLSVLEGISSNFFAVKEGKIHTAAEGVLDGITRRIVIQEAQQLGIEIDFTPVVLNDIAALQEAFITSTSRGVMPVAAIDGEIINDGKPGQRTKALMDAYQAYFMRNLEKI